MEVRDMIMLLSACVAFLSACIVIAGWFVNSELNRKHEIARQRMAYRLEALRSFLPVLFAVQASRTDDPQFAKDLAASRTQFQLYCYSREIDAFEKMVVAIEKRDDDAYTEALRTVVRIVREGIRADLCLDAFEPEKVANKAPEPTR